MKISKLAGISYYSNYQIFKSIMFQIKKVTSAESEALLAISKSTFYDFFGHLNTQANMEAYSSVAFNSENMFAQVADQNAEFYFAMLDSEIAGYIKLNYFGAQTEAGHPASLEVERIYVLRQHHGKKIGKQLLQFAIDTAIRKHFGYVWLGVWEHNDKAIAFYKSQGFQLFGSHDFMLGDDKQTDLLMKKELC